MLPSLFGADVPTTTVGAAWLNGLPLGTGIGPITIRNKGTDSTVLSGRPPFAGSNLLSVLDQLEEREPPSLRSGSRRCPRDLETICLKCLRKDPAQRYASALELAEDLA